MLINFLSIFFNRINISLHDNYHLLNHCFFCNFKPFITYVLGCRFRYFNPADHKLPFSSWPSFIIKQQWVFTPENSSVKKCKHHEMAAGLETLQTHEKCIFLINICTEFLKRIKVSISHHTDTPDLKLISYISYIYIFSPSCLRFHGWGNIYNRQFYRI